MSLQTIKPHTHSMRNCNQILHGEQSGVEIIFFYGRPRMLKRDLSAVADLAVSSKVILKLPFYCHQLISSDDGGAYHDCACAPSARLRHDLWNFRVCAADGRRWTAIGYDVSCASLTTCVCPTPWCRRHQTHSRNVH